MRADGVETGAGALHGTSKVGDTRCERKSGSDGRIEVLMTLRAGHVAPRGGGEVLGTGRLRGGRNWLAGCLRYRRETRMRSGWLGWAARVAE